MKIAFISDVHGNLPALETCLAAILERGCDELHCLGDTFGYFSDGVECFAALKRAGAQMMIGNHEAMLLGLLTVTADREDVYRLQPERDRMPAELRAELNGLLPFRALCLEGNRRALLVHGSPLDPLRGYLYPDSDLGRFRSLDWDFVFMGHTHRPFVRDEGKIRFVNVGSGGLPRDIGNLGCFAMFDSATGEVELVRVPLDAARIRARYPGAHTSVLAMLDRRPSIAAEMGSQ
jgi:predicted phosphodiesterase